MFKRIWLEILLIWVSSFLVWIIFDLILESWPAWPRLLLFSIGIVAAIYSVSFLYRKTVNLINKRKGRIWWVVEWKFHSDKKVHLVIDRKESGEPQWGGTPHGPFLEEEARREKERQASRFRAKGWTVI